MRPAFLNCSPSSCAFAAFLAAQTLVGQVPVSSPVPPDPEIRKILVDRIDTYRQSVGIVVGVIEPQGRRIVTHGRLDQGDPRALDGDTVFEIGSVTKVFTSLVLADMVQHGEVALTDPAAKYLPSDVKVPERGGRQITLQDLATHTSGLPTLPSNFAPKDPANWEARYPVEKLYRFLSTYQLKHDIGSHYEYSNLGASLLGIALARRAGMDYEALVQSRITGPLAMANTRVAITPEMKTRLAAGHAYALNPAPSFKEGIFVGGGGLRSTANDLLAFLAASLGYTQTALAPAMTAMLNVHRPIPPAGLRAVSGNQEIHLGWRSGRISGEHLVWKEGSTIGYWSFIGFDPKARVGVVVLSNDGSSPVEDIGIHLLNPKESLLGASALRPPKERVEVTVDPKVLDGYVGRYKSSVEAATVTREGGHLIFDPDFGQRLEFYSENSQVFFYKLADWQLTFKTDSQGRAIEMILHGGGSNQRWKRIE